MMNRENGGFPGDGENDSIPCQDVVDGSNNLTVALYCNGGPRQRWAWNPWPPYPYIYLDDKRVVSWDGQPIDADVTMPPEGDGPWPLIVMLHGYAGNKQYFETDNPASDGRDNIGLARSGYVVLNYSARGFGASCGFGLAGTGYLLSGYSFEDAVLAQLACPTDSWVHLADARFEARDTQYLAGLLVDEGIAEPAIGVTGVSYGGGQSLILSQLKDRIMPESCRSGSCEPQNWTSPDGTEMRVAGAVSVVPWSDLASATLPNGRSLDYELDHPTASPIGVKKDSWMDSLYLGGLMAGNYAPAGCNGTEPCPDLMAWHARISEGEPYEGGEAAEIANETKDFHSAAGIEPSGSGPAPTLIVSGWTDDIFPPIEGARFYNRTKEDFPDVPMAFRVADVGHQRAQNKGAETSAIEADGRAWLDHFVKGEGPEPSSGVQAWTQTCPRSTPSAGPYSAPDLGGLAAGSVTYASWELKTVDANGGRADLAEAIDPNPLYDQLDIGLPPDACRETTTDQYAGVATYALPTVTTARSYTMLGFPTISAYVITHGAGGTRPQDSDGQLAARLWDVNLASGTQILVSKGVYRLNGNQRGWIKLQLHGNGWRFEEGHRPKLELLGRDDASDIFGIGSWRASNNRDFTVTIHTLKLRLPTVERQPRMCKTRVCHRRASRLP